MSFHFFHVPCNILIIQHLIQQLRNKQKAFVTLHCVSYILRPTMAIIRKYLRKGTFVVDLPNDGHVKTTTCSMYIVKWQKFKSSSIIKPPKCTHIISSTIASLLTLLQHYPSGAHTKFFKNQLKYTKLYS